MLTIVSLFALRLSYNLPICSIPRHEHTLCTRVEDIHLDKGRFRKCPEVWTSSKGRRCRSNFNPRNFPLIRRPQNPQVNSAVSAVFSVADPQVRTFRTCLPACADSADSELRMCGYTEADNVRISSEYGGYSDRYCASNMSYVICAAHCLIPGLALV